LDHIFKPYAVRAFFILLFTVKQITHPQRPQFFPKLAAIITCYMNEEKLQFLKHRLVILLRQVPSDTHPLWGKMTLQQMVEHFSDSVRIASGKTIYTNIVTPEEHLEKMRIFLISEKPFKENTMNPLMPEVPAPVRNRSAEEAINELKTELADFFSYFEKNPIKATRNPIFGDLNFEENVQLLYKHALHHLKQFGITIEKQTQA
jgi:hypothetical protein